MPAGVVTVTSMVPAACAGAVTTTSSGATLSMVASAEPKCTALAPPRFSPDRHRRPTRGGARGRAQRLDGGRLAVEGDLGADRAARFVQRVQGGAVFEPGQEPGEFDRDFVEAVVGEAELGQRSQFGGRALSAGARAPFRGERRIQHPVFGRFSVRVDFRPERVVGGHVAGAGDERGAHGEHDLPADGHAGGVEGDEVRAVFDRRGRVRRPPPPTAWSSRRCSRAPSAGVAWGGGLPEPPMCPQANRPIVRQAEASSSSSSSHGSRRRAVRRTSESPRARKRRGIRCIHRGVDLAEDHLRFTGRGLRANGDRRRLGGLRGGRGSSPRARTSSVAATCGAEIRLPFRLQFTASRP